MKVYFKRVVSFVLMILPAFIVTSTMAGSLSGHPSPYLNLHANDPVNWQTWDREVLRQARSENKLIYLSIGYFSCHWCHVMHRESYQDPEVADFLNKHFIAVKVDRELRPSLDRRMIRFVEAVRGVAGWPLNVFITADGYPVTGFTYLPRDDFLQVLGQLQQQWSERREEISLWAKQYFQQSEFNENRSTLLSLPDENFDKVVDAFVSQAMLIGDELQGGFGDSNKFPSYPQLKALLTVVRLRPDVDPDVPRFVQLTLDNMATHHLMDHVNGGFFRYVTDPDWQTPHFEKMLYDNAQLAILYFDAAVLWPDRGYADIGLRTLDFMQRFLADADGGFNASLSAVDENNIEGAGYLWTVGELKQVMDKREFSHLQRLWSLPEQENRSLQLNPLVGLGSPDPSGELNETILNKLQQVRKPRMPVDDKKLAGWNALALKALLKSQPYAKDKRLFAQADQLYEYIRRHFIKEDMVVRFAGQSDLAETTLEDYAQLANAVQTYAVARKDKDAERLAVRLSRQAVQQYYVDGRWIQDPDSLIPGETGSWIVQDGVLESPVSLLMEAILMMADPDPELQQLAGQQIRRLTRDVLDVPYHYASAIMLRKNYQHRLK